jgi:hypothetical protein
MKKYLNMQKLLIILKKMQKEMVGLLKAENVIVKNVQRK